MDSIRAGFEGGPGRKDIIDDHDVMKRPDEIITADRVFLILQSVLTAIMGLSIYIADAAQKGFDRNIQFLPHTLGDQSALVIAAFCLLFRVNRHKGDGIDIGCPVGDGFEGLAQEGAGFFCKIRSVSVFNPVKKPRNRRFFSEYQGRVSVVEISDADQSVCHFVLQGTFEAGKDSMKETFCAKQIVGPGSGTATMDTGRWVKNFG